MSSTSESLASSDVPPQVTEFTSSLKHSPSPSSEDSHIMSERVQNLANGIYMEFENMIRKYDEDVVKNVMPLIVGVLENLEKAISDKTSQEVELELLKEDNEQLLVQFDREKQLRKASEERLLTAEDAFDLERKSLNEEKESIQSICKMLELKSRNAQDHASRLEEKESESRRECQRLHDRYTELFRTHMDHVERAKLMLEKNVEVSGTTGSSARTRGYHQQRSKNSQSSLSNSMPTAAGAELPQSIPDESKSNVVHEEPPQPASTLPSHEPSSPGKSLLSETTVDVSQEQSLPVANVPVNTTTTLDDLDDIDVLQQDTQGITLPIAGASSFQPPLQENTLYDEVSFEDADALGDIDDGADIVGMRHAELFSGDYGNADEIYDDDVDEFGMSKEIENLIKENSELIETKNALNIVKDDLIAKVDELTCEKDMLHDEVESLRTLKSKLKERVAALEDDNRSLRDEVDKLKSKVASGGEDDESIPMAQRKRFTRVEMARVLMERNQYKERLMELQEAVRWTEMIRASREHPELAEKKKGSVWNFFGKFIKNRHDSTPSSTDHHQLTHSPSLHFSPTGVTPVGDPNRMIDTLPADKRRALDFMQSQQEQHTHQQLRRPARPSLQNRPQAYGWALPSRPSDDGRQVTIPVPVYCRPLLEKQKSTKVWCAAGVISNHSTAFSSSQSPKPSGDDNSQQLQELANQLQHELQDLSSTPSSKSSMVWICTSQESAVDTLVCIVDMNQPADILLSFPISQSHVVCISGAPAASSNDLPSNAGITSEEELTLESAGMIRHIKCIQKTENIKNPLLLDSTMWLGCQNGLLMVHSAIKNWKSCLSVIQLKDSVVDLCHIRGRMFAALANGSMVMFRRDQTGWDLSGYLQVTVGTPATPLRVISPVGGSSSLWIGSQNMIHVMDPVGLKVSSNLEAHPKKDSQVRLLSPAGEGVWVSFRLEACLRLYHAHTHQLLQEIDVEPYISKLLGTSKLGFSLVRITSLMIACHRLWVGTGNGVIVSVPIVCRDEGASSENTSVLSNLLPTVDLSQAQLSFHGHKDVVKFFLSVPGRKKSLHSSQSSSSADSTTTLVLSGGEGYIDFRTGEVESSDDQQHSSDNLSQKVDNSHLIVWQVTSNK